ncbi:hypothetical protein CYMTET_41243 [Cymbomonas tetramitiformis]|uniref:Uncharacterized protein n=1 Tax=Cymbomonas tetramitiformis TaxID=36881 RepID=A0AAE0C6G0_9CHLO|nr:hypothetical protein CYMTET_41243 [Cymbomonas tetramitiformis]
MAIKCVDKLRNATGNHKRVTRMHKLDVDDASTELSLENLSASNRPPIGFQNMLEWAIFEERLRNMMLVQNEALQAASRAVQPRDVVRLQPVPISENSELSDMAEIWNRIVAEAEAESPTAEDG